MKSAIKTLLSASLEYLTLEMVLRQKQVRMKVKDIIGGAAAVFAAVSAAYLSLLFLLASFFFWLAGLEAFVSPALITGLVALALVVLLAALGMRKINRVL